MFSFFPGFPYLDALKNNIERRFEDAIGIITASSIFEPNNLPHDPQQLSGYGVQRLEDLISFYGEETSMTHGEITTKSPPDIDAANTRVEWKAFKLIMATDYQNSTLQDMLASLLKKPAAKAMYPNILFLMQVCVSLPVSTATVERSFSDMKQIKTRLRSRLLHSSLGHLNASGNRGT